MGHSGGERVGVPSSTSAPAKRCEFGERNVASASKYSSVAAPRSAPVLAAPLTLVAEARLP